MDNRYNNDSGQNWNRGSRGMQARNEFGQYNTAGYETEYNDRGDRSNESRSTGWNSDRRDWTGGYGSSRGGYSGSGDDRYSSSDRSWGQRSYQDERGSDQRGYGGASRWSERDSDRSGSTYGGQSNGRSGFSGGYNSYDANERDDRGRFSSGDDYRGQGSYSGGNSGSSYGGGRDRDQYSSSGSRDQSGGRYGGGYAQDEGFAGGSRGGSRYNYGYSNESGGARSGLSTYDADDQNRDADAYRSNRSSSYDANDRGSGWNGGMNSRNEDWRSQMNDRDHRGYGSSDRRYAERNERGQYSSRGW